MHWTMSNLDRMPYDTLRQHLELLQDVVARNAAFPVEDEDLRDDEEWREELHHTPIMYSTHYPERSRAMVGVYGQEEAPAHQSTCTS